MALELKPVPNFSIARDARDEIIANCHRCGCDVRIKGMEAIAGPGLNVLLAQHNCEKAAQPTMDKPAAQVVDGFVRKFAGPPPRNEPRTAEDWLRELDRRCANAPDAQFGQTVLELFREMLDNRQTLAPGKSARELERQGAERARAVQQASAESYTKGLAEGTAVGKTAGYEEGFMVGMAAGLIKAKKESERSYMMNPDGANSDDAATRRFALLEIDEE